VKSKTMFVGASSGRGSWREVINEFKYLGLWFDRHMRGNVQLEKLSEKAEEWEGKVERVSRKDEQFEVERGRVVWELLGRPSMENRGMVDRLQTGRGLRRDGKKKTLLYGKRWSIADKIVAEKLKSIGGVNDGRNMRYC